MVSAFLFSCQFTYAPMCHLLFKSITHCILYIDRLLSKDSATSLFTFVVLTSRLTTLLFVFLIFFCLPGSYSVFISSMSRISFLSNKSCPAQTGSAMFHSYLYSCLTAPPLRSRLNVDARKCIHLKASPVDSLYPVKVQEVTVDLKNM